MKHYFIQSSIRSNILVLLANRFLANINFNFTCFSGKLFFWRQVFRRYFCTADVHPKPSLFQLTTQI